MNTSIMFVEILIIGSCSMLWAYPVIKYFDINISLLIKQPIILFLIIYYVGLLLNNISDIILKNLDKKILVDITNTNKKDYSCTKKNIQSIRTRITLYYSSAITYMNFRRSIVRVFRANILNFALFFLFFLFFTPIYVKYYELPDKKWLICSLIFILLFGNLIAFYRSLKGYYKYLIQVEEVINIDKK